MTTAPSGAAYFVLGGTSGIGLATARLLAPQAAAEGARSVYVGGRSDPGPQAGLTYLQADVRDEESLRTAFGSIAEQTGGRLAGLVYATGIAAPPREIVDFDAFEFERLQRTNVTGALLALKYAYPMLKAASGRVVVVSSVAARIGSRLSGFEYTISKAALSGMVKHLALQWAPDRVLINSVFPSMTRTPMLEQAVSAETIALVEQKIPLGRIAEPEDTARAIAFLISPENTYITGSGIDIAGGLYLNG